MATLDQLLLLVSGLGGLHGLLLAGYFFFRQPSAWANRFLAGLILVLSIRVLKSVLFYFNPAIGKQILQLGLSACFLIGPLLYCYTLQFLGIFAQSRLSRLHLLLPVMLVIIVGLSLPYHLNPELWGRVFYKVINYNWLLYTLLSFATLLPRVRLISKDDWRQEADLIIVFFIIVGNGLVWSAYFFASYTSYISGALSFSFLMCIGVLAVLWHLHQKNQTSTPYANKKMSEEHAEPFILDLEKMMTEKRVYLDANLTLPRLAKMLSWSAPKLSQLLNDNLQKSFTEYVNAYRIEHAKTLLMGESMIKMEDLAERCGFNSLSTFYSAFKKHTQLTPAKYRTLQSANTSEIINS